MDSPLSIVILNHSTPIHKKQGTAKEIKRKQQKYIILIIMEFIEYLGKETAWETLVFLYQSDCFFMLSVTHDPIGTVPRKPHDRLQRNTQ